MHAFKSALDPAFVGEVDEGVAQAVNEIEAFGRQAKVCEMQHVAGKEFRAWLLAAFAAARIAFAICRGYHGRIEVDGGNSMALRGQSKGMAARTAGYVEHAALWACEAVEEPDGRVRSGENQVVIPADRFVETHMSLLPGFAAIAASGSAVRFCRQVLPSRRSRAVRFCRQVLPSRRSRAVTDRFAAMTAGSRRAAFGAPCAAGFSGASVDTRRGAYDIACQMKTALPRPVFRLYVHLEKAA
jgi:hypothetical protein